MCPYLNKNKDAKHNCELTPYHVCPEWSAWAYVNQPITKEDKDKFCEEVNNERPEE